MQDQMAPWKRRDNLSVLRHQEVVDQLNRLSDFGGEDENFSSTATGVARSSTRREFKIWRTVAVIVPEGPSNAADFEDHRYWVHPTFAMPLIPSLTKISDKLRMVPEEPNKLDDGTIYDSRIVPAHNLAEMPPYPATQLEAGEVTHEVISGSFVELFAYEERLAQSIQVVYLFNQHAGLPRPQYQWQSYLGRTQNQPGWDFIRAHGLLPPTSVL